MRWLSSICALFIGASVSGCAIIEAEKHNRGGFLDQTADHLWMKADSKKMRALRALAIEASLARIAMIAPKSAPDRALLARRIGETSRRADVVRRCAFLQLQIPGQRADEPCFFFDSVMVDYENALFDLALVALPIDDARTLITRVSGGVAAIAINPLELVQTLVEIGREAFRYGRVVGAIYRDTLELEVQVWLASPAFEDAERARGLPEQFVVTHEKVAGLRAAYVRGNDNIPAWQAEIAALRAQGLEPIPDQRFITEIFAILKYICGQIVHERDPAYEECTQSQLIRNLPLATGAGGSLFRSGTRISTSVVRRETQSERAGDQARIRDLQRQARQQHEENKQLEQKVEQLRLASNDTERRMRATDLQTYKQALCVAGADAMTDSFDTQTRERLREFVSGDAWAPAIAQSATPVAIDPRVENKLREAVKISPSCTVANSVAKNAYELGVYARSGIAAVDTEMMHALRGLRLNDALRGREAINVLRRASAQQPQIANGPQLDPSLWAFIVTEAVKHRRGIAPQQPPPPPPPR